MNDENLRKVYEQYWLHARHQETQRLWFTNVYALIVTGVLTFFGKLTTDDPGKVILLIFLVLLTLFGYLITYSWNLPLVIYSRLAELISIKEWNLAEDYQRFTKYTKGIRAGRLFMGLYSLMLGLFVSLLARQTWGDIIWIPFVIGLIVFLASYLLYYLYLDRVSIGRIQKEFEEKVKKQQAAKS